MSRPRLALLLTVLALLAAACGDPLDPAVPDSPDVGQEVDAVEDDAAPGEVVIGSTNFTEQLILAEMYAALLEQEGFDVETRLNLGNREVVFPALEAGEIDLLPEYTGALVAFLQGEPDEAAGQTTEDLVARLEELLPEELVALEPAVAQDKDAFAVTEAFAAEHDLETLSDLAAIDEPIVIGGPPELETRYSGLPGLAEVYGIDDVEFRALDAGGPLTLGALESGQIDVGRVFTTQGTLAGRGLVVLEDDRGLVPAENLIPIAREEVATDELRSALNELSAALTDEDLIELNRRVDQDNEDPAVVAEAYLREAGLLE